MSIPNPTDRILERFAQISAVPRPSKSEAAVRALLVKWAESRGFDTRVDSAGNLAIDVPGSAGHEGASPVILQGHLDMVCEKTPESSHDFSRDPIVPVREGEWLTARGTTLGADNGIAVALGMVAATDEQIVRPPLELLFTVDEETGLTGATALEPGFVHGRRLINLDSEDEGVVTVGCAGGLETMLYLPLEHEAVPAGWRAWRLTAGGMVGGHSGVDIHCHRANAIRVLARALQALGDEVGPRLAGLTGGSAHNAIPRDAAAVLLLPAAEIERAIARLNVVEVTLRAEFSSTDPDLSLRWAKASGAAPARCLTAAAGARAVDFLLAVPHGIAAMSTEVEGLVETSNNEATVALKGGRLAVRTSQRSSVPSRLAAHTQRIEAIARLAGGEAVSSGGYPPWKPNLASDLLARCKRIYAQRFGREPVVEIIHAGLECGLIGERYPEMDMISIGPTICAPHSPDEKLHLPSVERVWVLLVALLADLAGAEVA